MPTNVRDSPRPPKRLRHTSLSPACHASVCRRQRLETPQRLRQRKSSRPGRSRIDEHESSSMKSAQTSIDSELQPVPTPPPSAGQGIHTPGFLTRRQKKRLRKSISAAEPADPSFEKLESSTKDSKAGKASVRYDTPTTTPRASAKHPKSIRDKPRQPLGDLSPQETSNTAPLRVRPPPLAKLHLHDRLIPHKRVFKPPAQRSKAVAVPIRHQVDARRAYETLSLYVDQRDESDSEHSSTGMGSHNDTRMSERPFANSNMDWRVNSSNDSQIYRLIEEVSRSIFAPPEMTHDFSPGHGRRQRLLAASRGRTDGQQRLIQA